jgi:hypothetical protein
VHELYTLLASFRGGNPASVAVLREKLASLNVMAPLPQELRVIGYHEEVGGEDAEGLTTVQQGSPYSESRGSVESGY